MRDSILLSIVIVNWNTRALLAQCLQSLLLEIGNPATSDTEVFVVDNHSADDSLVMLQTEFPWVKVIANSENVGFGRANNQAIRQAAGQFVLLLNSDTKVLPGALRALTAFMQTNPQAGAAGARLFNADGSLQPSCHRVPTLGSEIWRMLYLDRLYGYAVYDMSQWSLEQPRQVDTVGGAALLVRREVIEQVGMFDEDYFMYTEEVDWCNRILRGGWAIYWVPTAQVIHYGGQSTQLVAQSMFLRLYESKILFFRKHHGTLATQLYKAVLALTALPRLTALPLSLLKRRGERQRHQRTARYYWQLLRELPGL